LAISAWESGAVSGHVPGTLNDHAGGQASGPGCRRGHHRVCSLASGCAAGEAVTGCDGEVSGHDGHGDLVASVHVVMGCGDVRHHHMETANGGCAAQQHKGVRPSAQEDAAVSTLAVCIMVSS
jgi:hypothetical protein